MKKNNFKYAFTLVELMVFFIFISLLLAASTPIITKRVKNLPIKHHHGKFVCYGNSYEYYNSSRLVSSGSGCKFTPPKRASLFKIELVGGGAGGCEYSDWGEDMETRSGGYNIPGGHYGDGYTDLQDGVLHDMLYQAPFIYAVEGTDGKPGESTDARTYTGVGSPKVTLNGACAGTCWSPTAYDCEKTGTRKKKDANGNYVKDEEGNYVYEEYTYTGTCYTTQKEDNMEDYPTCSACRSYLNTLYSIQSDVMSQKNCGTNDWCYNIATTEFADPYRTKAKLVGNRDNSWGLIDNFGTESEATGYGARGGYGQDFYIEGTIDFCDYSKGGTCPNQDSNEYKRVMGGVLQFSYGQKMDDGRYCMNTTCTQKVSGTGVKPYLESLFGTYLVKGTTSAPGSCAGWGTIKYKEHPNTKVGSSKSTYMHGQDGDDVLHYDALKTWGENCTTNAKPAGGGEGGWYWDKGSFIYGTNGTNLGIDGTLNKPVDASDYGIIDKSKPWAAKVGLKRDRIPSLATSTTLNERWHEVGAGGGAASYKIAYVSNIDKDCVFNVASGGPAIIKGMSEAQVESIHDGLTTSLTCNEGTLRLTAEGGQYDTSTSITTYSGFDYMTSAGVFTNPSTFTTSTSGGASPFSPKDVYTKYIIGKYGFGAGGRGTEITDSCTKPYGEWSVDRVYYDGIDKSDHQTWPQEPCNGVSTSSAESGSPGVIIISW